jgi:hypothetical protein
MCLCVTSSLRAGVHPASNFFTKGKYKNLLFPVVRAIPLLSRLAPLQLVLLWAPWCCWWSQ